MISQKSALLLVLILLISSLNQLGFSQSTSNRGTDFWVAYTGHVDNEGSRLTLFISSETNAVVNINAGGVQLSPISLLPNQAQSVVLDPTTYTNIYIGSNNVVESNKGIHVTSDNPIIVYSHISRSARSAASLIIPTKALGNEYYSINYKQVASTVSTPNRYSEFTLVGVEDNTTVEITPAQSDIDNSYSANETFQVVLENKGDVYQYQSATDLSGSLIRTLNGCKPLAVFSGSTFTAFCEDGSTKSAGSGDNLYQQLIPVSAWGKNFVSAPFYNTEHGATDIYRIIVSKDNTTIQVNNSFTDANGTPLTNPYSKGDIITFFSKTANVVKANNPISLTQLQTTQVCNLSNTGNNNSALYPGDPEMTILSPIEQTLTDVTVYSAISTTAAPTAINKHYINIIIKTADAPQLKIDGSTFAPSSFTQINSEYSYLIHDVTASSVSNPTHRITAEGGFVAIAYGYGIVESYAYLAGADLKNLNQFVQLENPVNQQMITNACVNQEYKIGVVLPYITNTLSWDLGNGVSKNYTNPAYTAITSNGITAYKYEYPESTGAIYATPGKKVISITALNPAPAGCDATEITKLDFEVFDLPISQFTLDKPSACEGSGIDIKNISTGGIIKKWMWDFGDGQTETRLTADPFSHIYTSPGDYEIKLFVESDKNCLSTVYSQQVHIAKKPLADFNHSSLICEQQAITFTDLSVPQEGNITSWTWDFDGEIVTKTSSAAVNHTFATAGTKKIRLQVTTDLGCVSAWKELSILVKPKPVVDFSVPDFCLNDAIAIFTSLSTIADGTEGQFTYIWNFGDPLSGAANISTVKNGSHTYQSSGVYQVTLTVKSVNGCEATSVKSFTVNGSIPKALFTVQNENNLCSNQSVIVEDRSIVDFGEITRIEWFPDYGTDQTSKIVDDSPGLRGNAPNQYIFNYPAFTSPASKTVIIRMVAYSGASCYSIIDKTITIKAVPEVDFKAIPAICQNSAPYKLTEAVEKGNVVGTGVYSGTGVDGNGFFDPQMAGLGTHVITYTFTSNNNCIDYKTQTITVLPIATVSAGADLVLLDGGRVQINPVISNGNFLYSWSPSTGLDRTDISNPIASPSEDITYTLTVTTDEGCTVSDDVFVKVLKQPEVPNTFTPNADGVNDVWMVKYLESYPNCTINVFNRFGGKVFSSIGYTDPWNGKSNGVELPVGTYYYIIDPKNGRSVIKGAITILR